jgi:hypothetical protein
MDNLLRFGLDEALHPKWYVGILLKLKKWTPFVTFLIPLKDQVHNG